MQGNEKSTCLWFIKLTFASLLLFKRTSLSSSQVELGAKERGDEIHFRSLTHVRKGKAEGPEQVGAWGVGHRKSTHETGSRAKWERIKRSFINSARSYVRVIRHKTRGKVVSV